MYIFKLFKGLAPPLKPGEKLLWAEAINVASSKSMTKYDGQTF